MLEVEGVSFAYGHSPRKGAARVPEKAHCVLDKIDLAVGRGTCMCLMGVNGCGKSTLLDCILGEHRPVEGSIRIGGESAVGMRAARLASLVAYVPQVHERSFPYTVRHVVLMGRLLDNAGLPSEEDERVAMRALGRCGIGHLADRPYTSLSGGEMQMLMLARALVQNTPVIIMDEPTAHLDFKNQLRFLETVERLVRDEGITVLMATHSPNEAFHLESCGVPVEVAVMSRGRIVRKGTPTDVLGDALLRDVFGVVGTVADIELEATAGLGAAKSMRQIVPLKTLDCEEPLSKGDA